MKQSDLVKDFRHVLFDSLNLLTQISIGILQSPEGGLMPGLRHRQRLTLEVTSARKVPLFAVPPREEFWTELVREIDQLSVLAT